MTDPRPPASDARPPAAACPGFEDLSSFADGELDDARAAAIYAHVAGCERCTTLAVRLRATFGPMDDRYDGGIGGSGCAGEERLTAYLTSGLSYAEQGAMDRHLDACDQCIASLSRLQRRLGIMHTVDVPVPADIQVRARGALERGVRDLAAAAERARPRGVWWADLRSRLSELIQLPILIPAAVAAGALLVVSVQQQGTNPTPDSKQSRGVSSEDRLRVTAAEAPVRSRPSMRADVVATLHRGAVVEVAGEERDWYRVILPGDQTGWVVREAFE